MPILLALVLVCVTATLTEAVEGSSSSGSDVVKGDVMYWEGDEIVVKEMSGRQVRLRVTPETKIVGAASKLKAGDKIAAQVNSDGHALSITLQIPDGGAGGTGPGAR